MVLNTNPNVFLKLSASRQRSLLMAGATFSAETFTETMATKPPFSSERTLTLRTTTPSTSLVQPFTMLFITLMLVRVALSLSQNSKMSLMFSLSEKFMYKMYADNATYTPASTHISTITTLLFPCAIPITPVMYSMEISTKISVMQICATMATFSAIFLIIPPLVIVLP